MQSILPAGSYGPGIETTLVLDPETNKYPGSEAEPGVDQQAGSSEGNDYVNMDLAQPSPTPEPSTDSAQPPDKAKSHRKSKKSKKTKRVKVKEQPVVIDISKMDIH